MREIVRAFSAPRWRRIVGAMGSQMGKTDATLNVIGHRLDDDPTPTIYLGPSRNFCETQLEPRLTAMLRSAESLWAKTAIGKRNRKTLKHVAGVTVRLAWAGSATELASQAAGLVLVDERDRMESSDTGEGDPVELIAARGATYADFTMGIFSTPLVGTVETEIHPETGLEHWKLADPEDLESPTWRLWQEGSRHEWAWPCPECGDYFVPRFKHLRWPEDSTPAQAAREARLVCPGCGCLIADHHKTAMNARGVFLAPGQKVVNGAVVGPEPEGDTASFWVSGLASPWITWGSRAASWLKAVRSGDPDRMQATKNTGFGELWSRAAAIKEAKVADAVMAHVLPYAEGTVPVGAVLLTCGVDVQMNRLVVSVRAWGPRMESWLVLADELWGPTDQDAVWDDLERLLNKEFGGQPIRLMLIDSGFRPGDKHKVPDHMVYNFARKHSARVRACKGHDRLDRPIASARIDVSWRGKTLKGGLTLWHLDSDYFKSFVHGRLDWPAGQPGGWHVHQGVTESYAKQIVAEARRTLKSGAPLWVRLAADNHYLDCEALNAAAAYMLRVQDLPIPADNDDEPLPVTAPPKPAILRSKWMSE